jgi:Bacteriocin-protection, YdeI or OmpD-Associated/Domain of unknown function (DUF1905)
LKFRAKILLSGKSATGIQVPAQIVENLGSSKRPPVRVTIKGHEYRSTVATMGGKFMIPVSAEQRANAGVAAGDEVEVDIKLDTENRKVEVPPDFLKALNEDANARRNFEALSYSGKRRLVLTIDQAKTSETRQRRISKAIDMLNEG